MTDERTLRDLLVGIDLVATDLDGTLLRHGHDVSAYTVDVLARARATGLPVVFVTGRPPRWMSMVVDATKHAGVAVCANGALVVDLATDAVLASHPVEPSTLETVVRTLREELPGIGFAIEWVADSDALPFAHETAYVPRMLDGRAASGADVIELAHGHDVVKLLARVDAGHDADSFLEHALEHVAHLVTVTHSNAADVLLEMSAPGITKGSTLAWYAGTLGLGAGSAAAVGDMPNDVPMLEWARVGLGVEGAHPQVLRAADAVVPGPDHDGVAQVVDAVLATR